MKREEETEKSHKQHRQKKDKLEKKLQFKKHKKKEKDKRKQEKDNEKDDSGEIIEKTIYTVTKKLIKFDQSTANELPNLFGELDEGNEMNIADIENDYVKHKLYKLLKLMGVPHYPKAKFTFKKDKLDKTVRPKDKPQPLKEKILAIIKKCQEELKNKAENKESSSESEEQKGDHQEEQKKGQKIEEENPKCPNPTQEEPIDSKPAMEKKKKQEENKGANFLKSTLNAIEDAEKEKAVGPEVPISVELDQYTDKKELLEQYNKIFRPKSLLQEHQEKMGKKAKMEVPRNKAEKLKEFMARPFDRKKDLEISRVESKEAFKIVHGTENLSSKFSSKHFLNQL